MAVGGIKVAGGLSKQSNAGSYSSALILSRAFMPLED